MKRYTAIVLVVTLALLHGDAIGQEEQAHPPVGRIFAGQLVINTQSVDLLPTVRGMGVMIQHRFGAFGPDRQAYMQLLGMDLPSNIRFGFSYTLFDRVQLDLGRTKEGKLIDGGVKVAILRQTADNHIPLSVSAYLNAVIMTDDFPVVSDREFFADSITPFTYSFAHRMYYSAQVMVARKFGSRFSLQISPIVTYRNLAPTGNTNLTFALPLSGRVKVSPKGSILFEYGAVVHGRQAGRHLDPFSIGYEVATAGHAFQFILSTSGAILENSLYATPTERYDQGYFLLGFNIARQLHFKPRRPRP